MSLKLRALRRAGLAAGLLATILASGCQTMRSWQDGCPGVYSGVRYYDSQIGEMPWDGKIFFGLDLPFTAVFDTLLLPVSWVPDREQPHEGWVPGCKWAK